MVMAVLLSIFPSVSSSFCVLSVFNRGWLMVWEWDRTNLFLPSAGASRGGEVRYVGRYHSSL